MASSQSQGGSQPRGGVAQELANTVVGPDHFPQHLIVSADNTSREAKNQYFLGLLAWMRTTERLHQGCAICFCSLGKDVWSVL